MGKFQDVYRKFNGNQKLLKIRFIQKLLEDVSDENLQMNIITAVHNRAHRGTQENKSQILRKYYLPKMQAKIKKNCF